MKTCSIEGCVKKHYARGWCGMHYQRWRLLGAPGEPAPRFDHRIIEEKFWDYVDRKPSRKPCWEWLRAPNADGYGVVRDKYRGSCPAHRVAYELTFGPIPEGLEIDHLCRNRICCNPWHLEAVPPRENKMRGEGIMAKQARQTHCKRGHPLEGDNLKPDPRLGRRICKECVHMHRRDRYVRLGK